MSAYEQLVFSQEQNQTNLNNFRRNYRKDGADRKTTFYFEKRLKMLDSYFESIKNTHAQLLLELYANESELSKENYFKKNVFSDLESLYLSIYDLIQGEFLAKYPVEKVVEVPSNKEPSTNPSHSFSNDFNMSNLKNFVSTFWVQIMSLSIVKANSLVIYVVINIIRPYIKVKRRLHKITKRKKPPDQNLTNLALLIFNRIM